MKLQQVATALIEEDQHHAAVLRAVRREELLLEWQLERELQQMRSQRRKERQHRAGLAAGAG